MNIDLVQLARPLTWLKGSWNGTGEASFPTHDTYRYENTIKVRWLEEAFENEPLIHFEEIAWVFEDRGKTFKHWETGFFKPDNNGSIQLYVCHNTGRVEITYGNYLALDQENGHFKIAFSSQSIRNDNGTKVATGSRRIISFQDNILRYQLEMSTEDVPHLTHHLSAELNRD